jgi:hypothetical protein
MKIGILTQPLRNNYGGLLQNFALQHVLKGMGHQVETVDWLDEYSKYRIMLARAKNTLLSYIRKDVEKPRYKPTAAEAAVMARNTRRFVERYIGVCPLHVSHQEDFRNVDGQYGYDAYVVGSDQVWRPGYNAFLSSMFLDFTAGRDDLKRVAYAASFGTSSWEFTPQMTEECSQLAKRFDIITVREESGVALCREHLGVDAGLVLDPTMLLDRENYEQLVADEKEPESPGTLFHYILDPSDGKRELIEQIAGLQGLQPFTVMPKCHAEKCTKQNVKHHIEDCVFPPVTSWLRGFMDAEITVVDSFHGAVFSIIFNKPFWVIGNSKRGNARFESLLGMLGLQDRMVSLDCTSAAEWDKAIDWQRVNEIIGREKEKSLALLRQGLA